jgi:16S rRNA processing protein RimM
MEKIAVGYIRTSHGVRGLLKVVSYSGELEHFKGLTQIELRHKGQCKTFRVERFEEYGNGLLLKLAGIDNPEDGKALSRWEIWVDKDLAASLEDGEFYQADLVGCTLVFQGEILGTVHSIIENAAQDLMEIEIAGRKDRPLVPFLDKFIGKVDLKEKEIELLERWVLQ